MVLKVLIAQRNPKDPLAHQRPHRMLDQLLAAPVPKTRSKAIDQPNRTLAGAKQQRPGIRGHLTASKISDNFAPF